MYKCWRIYTTNSNEYFNIDIRSRKIAKRLCKFYERRDNEKYRIRRWYYLIGIPDFKDEEIMEALNNV